MEEAGVLLQLYGRGACQHGLATARGTCEAKRVRAADVKGFPVFEMEVLLGKYGKTTVNG